MEHLRSLMARVAVGWYLTVGQLPKDRGDNPISTGVISAILAAGAVTVAGAVILAATGWTDHLPKWGGK